MNNLLKIYVNTRFGFFKINDTKQEIEIIRKLHKQMDIYSNL